jgi:hypothetical protein
MSDHSDKVFPAPGKSPFSSFPGFSSEKDDFDDISMDYEVKYIKGSIDDEVFKGMIEHIETEGLKGEEIQILNKATFSCDTEFFIVLQYLQKKRGEK